MSDYSRSLADFGLEQEEKTSFVSGITPGLDDPRIIPPRSNAGRKPLFGVPIACWLILIVELCERFAYYGAANVMPLYMKDMLEWNNQFFFAIWQIFKFWGYLTPILGGYLADARFGRYKTIIIFAIMYIIGASFLTISSCPFSFGNWNPDPQIDPVTNATVSWMPGSNGGWATYGMFVAIFFIGAGMGGIKSNVSTMVAEQVPDADDSLIERVFRYFYLSINVGSLVANLAAPFLHHGGTPRAEINADGSVGYFGTSFYASYALVLGVLVLGTILFAAGKRFYYLVRPSGSIFTELFRALKAARVNKKNSPDEQRGHYLDWAVPEVSQSLVDEFKQVFRATRVFMAYPIFWLIYDQTSSNFVSQGEWMAYPSWWTPDQMSSFNSLAIIIFIPLMEVAVMPWWRKRGYPHGPIGRMTIGFIIISTSMIYAGLVQWGIEQVGYFTKDANGSTIYLLHEGKQALSAWIQIGEYVIVAIGEIFASVTGLEFAFSQSPPSMKSLVMALYLFTNAIAALIGLVISPVMKPENLMTAYFSFFGAMVLFTIIFWFIFRNLEVISRDDEYDDVLPLQPSASATFDGKLQSGHMSMSFSQALGQSLRD